VYVLFRVFEVCKNIPTGKKLLSVLELFPGVGITLFLEKVPVSDGTYLVILFGTLLDWFF